MSEVVATGKYKPYPAYKDSGIEWLGQVPEKWVIGKVKHDFEIGRGRVISQEELDDNAVYPVYSSQTKNDGILGYIDSYDFEGELITWTTDGANAGTVFLRDGKYNCTNVCGTLRPITQHFDIKFVSYFLSNATQYYKRPDTNGAKIMNNEMADIVLIQTNIHEQQSIANFLDQETQKIDTLIEKQQKMIELLKEKRQAVISHAVTKGLNPNAKMKDSGIEWLGEIPEHWEVKSIKHVSTYNDDVLGEATPGDLDIKYVEISGVSSELGIHEIAEVRFSEAPSRARRIVKKGDVIVSTVRTYLKAIAQVKENIDNLVVSTGFAVIRPKRIYSSYLGYSFHSEYLISEVISSSVGISYPAINATELVAIKVPVPPINEQKEISSYLEAQTQKIDTLIDKSQQAIELLKERKTALISAAITGKIDVRGVELG